MFNFDVLVNGRPVKRYYDHYGRMWIEGRKGTAFTLRIKNNSYGKILGIISVDGLNVIDAKHVPIEESRGYIIHSYSSINIPGWKINEDEVREFYFTINGEDSYVHKVGADERNIGVIAAAVYKEKVYPITTYSYASPVYDKPWIDTYNTSSPTVFSSNTVFSSKNINISNCTSEMNFSCSVNSDSSYISREPIEKISVGSGERKEFRTHEANFEKGEFEGEVVIYYDTWEGLKKRGVLREDEKYRNRPRPFPDGRFCPDV